jgi:hypothetical protein
VQVVEHLSTTLHCGGTVVQPATHSLLCAITALCARQHIGRQCPFTTKKIIT